MSHPESKYKAFSLDLKPQLLTTTAGNLHNRNGPAVPVVLTLPIAPPIVRNQNSRHESWKIDHKVLEAYKELEWFKDHNVEPNMPHNGRSILIQWLDEDDEGISWTCCVPLESEASWCGNGPFRRMDRALAHVREHIGLKPFPCKGRCGTEGWYVSVFSW
jgi:hypothetical protein